MSRVKRSKNGQFAGSYAGAGAPTSGVRSLLDRVLRRPAAPAPGRAPLTPSGYDVFADPHNDPYGELNAAWRDSVDFNDRPAPAAAPSRTEPVALNDEQRFGMGNAGHTRIDAAQDEFARIVATPYEFTYADGQHVSIDFDADDARDVLRRIAHQVLLENGEITEPGAGTYRARRDVYSRETVEAAQRIYTDLDTTGFRHQRYAGEDTAMFPSQRTETGNHVTYRHGMHPVGHALITGVRHDQAHHAGLQADIAAHRAYVADRQARLLDMADPFADI